MMYTLIRNADKTVRFEGVDFSNRKPMRIAYEDRSHIVIHIPAGSVWSGLGQPHSYIPARFMVLRLTADPNVVEEVVRFEARPPRGED